jgi:HEAT repeats/PBS lyase HEAT-like repeat
VEEVWAEVMKEAASLSVEKLFELALEIDPHNSVQTNRVFWIGELARRGGGLILDSTLQFARSEDVARQCLGIDLLSDLGQVYDAPTSDECVEVLVAATESASTLIAKRAIHALGAFAPVTALPIILGKSRHSDEWIRLAVARTLWSFIEGPVGDSNEAVKILLLLMNDDFDTVRDSATFSLGLLTEADGPIIRDSLADRLDDPDDDTRRGAIASLARRRDPRAIRPLTEALERGEVDRHVLEAAACLADTSLFPLLCGLPDDGSQELAIARDRCSTKSKLAMQNNLKLFVELSSGRGLDVVLYSDRLSYDGPQLSQSKRMDLSWDFEALLNRAEGNIARMVDLVDSDICRDQS